MTVIAVSPQVKLEWMKFRKHAGKIREIENLGFGHPLLQNLLEVIQKNGKIACFVIEDFKQEFIGYIVYKFTDKWIYILDLAVLPEFNNPATITQVVERLFEWAKEKNRKFIVVDVRETNFSLQMILKQCNFKGTKVLRNFYKREDAYRMVLKVE